MRYRTVINLAIALAVLLLAEGSASYHVEDQLSVSGKNRMASIIFGGGAIYFAEFGFANPRGLGLRFYCEHHPVLDVDSTIFQNAHCLGFAYLGSVKKSAYEYDIVRIPLWFIFVLLALSCAVAVHKHRVAIREHLIWRKCIKCGYDLRATPDRCPECGTDVKPLPRGLMATLRSM